MKLLRTLLVLTAAVPASAWACPTCYGATDTALRSGMDSAILFMLGVTVVVLASIAAVFVIIARRARRVRRLSQELFIDELGQLHATKEKGLVEWNNS
jgi:threonine/homoserine/homoserine lactone efflux protein